MTQAEHRKILMSLFDAAVAAAQPAICLPPHFPPTPQSGRLIVIACGKAGASMARAAETHYAEAIAAGRFTGLCVTRKGYAQPLAAFELMEASHPVPDDTSAAAALRALELAGEAGEGDLVLALISGGASALWAAPAEGISLADKQDLTRALLKAGAPIGAINCVRKHLSRIKGGRLARAAMPARLVTLAISDVPGDAPDTIGSGPTVPDSATLADARDMLAKYNVRPAPAIEAALGNPANETPKPGDASFAGAEFILTAAPKHSLRAAADKVAALGYEPILLGDALEGEARDVARDHAALALEAKAKSRRVAILSGGELTVTIQGNGRGGPNQEYALALAIALGGATGIHALAADTDGSDGGSGKADDPAGAIIGPETLARAANNGHNPAIFLINNDSTGFFEMLDDLILCGPTLTNVNDLRAILVDPA
ncbi:MULTISPECIES: glycerate kinase [Rhodomicrobium]|uniref:glycerate kinase type-2 family protein n=1 Tax=Rhodomicrobium TaxID=1068 RepID=UPI000B4AE6DD|nr:MULTISPECIES: glycerate kinase [Rhodomicrobium]